MIPIMLNRDHGLAFLFEHDLFRKPVPTFRDHAPSSQGSGGPVNVGPALPCDRCQVFCRFSTGTGIPAIFSLTENSVLRLVKYSVFQSSPPKPMFVVAGWPCTMRPSLLPFGSRM